MMRILTEIQPGIDFSVGHILLIDKPLGWTSFDVVKKLRGTLCRYQGLKKIKVGHAGTLDPLATGLLVVATGKYTKLLHDLQNDEKAYSGTFELGASTSTYDAEGERIEGSDPSNISIQDVEAILPQFRGKILQQPPLYSAIKIKGQKAYSIARRGGSVELPARPIAIEKFEIREKQWPELEFDVVCSKGTYIRSLAHDLGQKLGTGAYLTGLRRTRSGAFHIREAWKLEHLVAQLEKA